MPPSGIEATGTPDGNAQTPIIEKGTGRVPRTSIWYARCSSPLAPKRNVTVPPACPISSKSSATSLLLSPFSRTNYCDAFNLESQGRHPRELSAQLGEILYLEP